MLNFPLPVVNRARLLLSFASILFSISVHATVTNVAWYRLGENDPGAFSGREVTNVTYNLVSTNHLNPYGFPSYTNNVSTNAAAQLGSSLAVHFNGFSQYFSNAVFTTDIDNFGVEAWVKPNNTNPSPGRFIVCNGYVTNGWALIQSGEVYGFLLGGVASVGAPGALSNVWTHVALVRNNGSSTLYINGIASGTNTTATPLLPTGGFALAAPAVNPFPAYSFNGTIDEVRLFTFGPGQFSTNDLSYYPAPATNPPTVGTLPATGVANAAATLNGTVNPGGLPTMAWFQWGTTTNYGNLTPVQSLGSGNISTNFSQIVTGLVAAASYHFRAVASNAFGVAFGTNQTFTLPPFYNIGAGLTPGSGGVAWGDYDNDGLQDIMLGATTNGAQLWRNTGNGFSNINVSFGVSGGSSVAWGDLDNDGLLDLAIVNSGSTAFRRNTGNGFTNPLPFVGFVGSAFALGDYDNDGRLDVLVSASLTFQLWRNTGSGFVNANAGLPNYTLNSLAWGDYDNDGQLDILSSGPPGSGGSRVYRNTGSGFSNSFSALPDVSFGSTAWGDFDADGKLDILIAGATAFSNGLVSAAVAQVWRNTGSGFTNINAGLPGVAQGSVAWGDYDNDGRLDILLCGTNTSAGPITQIWRNSGSGFTNINAGLTGVYQGSAAWGDYDNDSRLDVVLIGGDVNKTAVSQVWRNAASPTNSVPTAPSGLSVTISNSVATFSWNAASDAQSPAGGLTYNLRIGTSPGAGDALSAMSAANGLRRVPRRGNAENRLFATFNYSLDTPYYWSVQTVDGAFAGSPFAAEQDFRVLQPSPTLVSATVSNLVSGDLDGDGIVDQSELNVVLANYFPTSPWLYMTNVAGLGGTNVTFALTNSFAGAFSVEYSTNLADWYFLGPAIPRFLFTDTNAPVVPQRYYRLRWP
jgi:hypothetical protein